MTATAPRKGRLPPRRKLYAQAVLAFLRRDVARWSTGVVPFKSSTYVVCEQAVGFNWMNINLALDDLYFLKLVDIEMSENNVQMVRPLEGEVE